MKRITSLAFTLLILTAFGLQAASAQIKIFLHPDQQTEGGTAAFGRRRRRAVR